VNRATEWFFRALGAIYLIAFLSFGVQAEGLIGPQGILPLGAFLKAMHDGMGARAWWYVPTVFWAASGSAALRIAWLAGAALSIAAMLGWFRRVSLAMLLVLYLSVCTAGQDFWSFQWDILLLEAGFLGIFLDASMGRVWLMRWLLFKLTFMSGLVKLTSGDASWRGLTALSYHYLTQPLPTPLAWYMYQLPMWFQKASTVFTLAVELGAPFLIFTPRRFRLIGGCSIAGLQVLILLTGNYTFFNWLTLALCLFLIPERPARTAPPTWTHRGVSAALAVFVIGTGGLQLLEMISFPLPAAAASYLSWIAPLRIVNSYGLFAVMTTTRPEILVEGSQDGRRWLPYEFRDKPGDVHRAPAWVAPYQPRLDWQMWFAALGGARQNPWFYNFAIRLMQGSPPVLGLLRNNPFPSSSPRYLRAVVYDYRFTDWDERRTTGDWRARKEEAMYLPAVSLRARSARGGRGQGAGDGD